MAVTVMVRDENAQGDSLGAAPLEFPTAQITVRELIRERVYQEVQDALQGRRRDARGLVQPGPVEATLNAPILKAEASDGAAQSRKQLDWKKQFEIACDAFERNGFFILVDDRQVDTLDEMLQLSARTDVNFVRLTMLVGG